MRERAPFALESKSPGCIRGFCAFLASGAASALGLPFAGEGILAGGDARRVAGTEAEVAFRRRADLADHSAATNRLRSGTQNGGRRRGRRHLCLRCSGCRHDLRRCGARRKHVRLRRHCGRGCGLARRRRRGKGTGQTPTRRKSQHATDCNVCAPANTDNRNSTLALLSSNATQPVAGQRGYVEHHDAVADGGAPSICALQAAIASLATAEFASTANEKV